MSHVATVQCLIKAASLDLLNEAAQKFGGELVENQTSFLMWGSRREPCIHAIRLTNQPGAYEIGLRRAEANDPTTFNLAADFYDGRLNKAFGHELVDLRNEYLALVAEQQLRRGGYRVMEREQEGQRLTVRGVR